jgi:hypothetical protein
MPGLAGSGDRLEQVRALLESGFLAKVWDADGQVFAPPRTHPLLGLRKCAVVDCEAGVRTPNVALCAWCIPRFQASGLSVEQFAALPANKISRVEQFCRVLGCPRPSNMRVRFCHVHYTQWRKTSMGPEEFAASPEAVPLASFGECSVVSCSRPRAAPVDCAIVTGTGGKDCRSGNRRLISSGGCGSPSQSTSTTW